MTEMAARRGAKKSKKAKVKVSAEPGAAPSADLQTATGSRGDDAAATADKVAHVTLRWAGGVNRFELLGLLPPARHALAEFSDKRTRLHDGEHAIFLRLTQGGWGRDDLRRVIVAGLIGGGDFKPAGGPLAVTGPYRHVEDLVDKHVLGRPLAEAVPLATSILLAAIVGLPAAYADRIFDANEIPDALAAAA